MIIYLIINKVNRKVYVGQTVGTLRHRWSKHLCHVRKKTNRYLYDAMNHYGVESFAMAEIEKCDSREKLNEREIYWIAYYKSNQKKFGYNMTSGGQNGIRSPESIRKMIESKKGFRHTEESKKRISDANKNIPHSKEHNLKVSRALTGIKRSDETKAKISRAFKGRIPWISGKHHSKKTKKRLSAVRKGKTYEEIMPYDLAQDLKRRQREYVGEKAHAYKLVDKDTLLNYIKDGYDNGYIAKQLGISKPTVIEKTKKYFSKSPTQLRIEFFNFRFPLTREKEYKEISLQIVINMILSGKNRKEICKKLRISGATLNKRLLKKYLVKFKKFRKIVLNGEINNEKISKYSKD